jgi:hypothetical protein
MCINDAGVLPTITGLAGGTFTGNGITNASTGFLIRQYQDKVAPLSVIPLMVFVQILEYLQFVFQPFLTQR